MSARNYVNLVKAAAYGRAPKAGALPGCATPPYQSSDGRTATQMAWPSCGCLTDAAKDRKVLGKMTSMTFVGICTCFCPGACHNADRAEYCML